VQQWCPWTWPASTGLLDGQKCFVQSSRLAQRSTSIEVRVAKHRVYCKRFVETLDAFLKPPI